MIYNKEKKEIISERELNDLDKFALEFTNIIKKYTDYVIVSGYVSILLGRSRATEDIDVFIKKISSEKFKRLYKELTDNNFWCINSENLTEIYNFLGDKLAIRFAYEGKGIPNFEVKFPKDELDEDAFNETIKVKIGDHEIIISSLERQIAFKKYYLGSYKDVEDARHIEEIFREHINFGRIKKIKEQIKERKAKWKKQKFS